MESSKVSKRFKMRFARVSCNASLRPDSEILCGTSFNDHIYENNAYRAFVLYLSVRSDGKAQCRMTHADEIGHFSVSNQPANNIL